jgi:dTDP-4-dehydrorhamnose reductase
MGEDAAVELVIGADGLVGSALMTHLAASGRKVLGTTRRRDRAGPAMSLLDLAEPPSDWQIPRRVSVAYICAAMARVDDCLRDPKLSRRVNAEAPIALSHRLADSGAFIVLFSSNRVLSGDVAFENAAAPHSPTTEYGRQKAAAERGVLALGERGGVLRLTKIAETMLPLLTRWRKELRTGKPVTPFSDMCVSPVPLTLAVAAAARLAEHRLPGVTQASASDEISYAEVAHLLAERDAFDPGLIQPVPAGPFLSEPRPRHCSLDSARLRDELELIPPSARPCIEALLGTPA